MKIRWYSTGLCSLFLTMNIYAASEIIIPEQFDILKHNDKPYEQGLFDQDKKLVVEPGIHKFIVQYSDIIDLADSEFEEVVSREIIVVFDVQDKFRYVMTSIRPVRLEQAREFASSPVYNIERSPLLENEGNTVIVSESEELQRLKAIWLRASDEDKRKFEEWKKSK